MYSYIWDSLYLNPVQLPTQINVIGPHLKEQSFATNSNFQIPIDLQPKGANLGLTEFMFEISLGSMTFGCKDIWIRKSVFMVKTLRG